MSRDCLRTGDKARVKFRFIKHPEYLKCGQRMVFREGRTKAVGNVLRPEPSVSMPRASKPQRTQRHHSQRDNTHHAGENEQTADSPFDPATGGSGAGGQGTGAGGGGGRRPRKRHDKPQEHTSVAAN
ncbi:hypothetical protein O0L34_g6827 [Tuta absoluta]|nr:hypothetical protein O0L34_g6827 [Tuta absoluta]